MEEPNTMYIRERSDLQLLRISRGAHELNHMIDSWSKTSTLGFESIQMANKLLRGSLELQESLQTLSRLQEASRRMSKKRIRQRGREDDREENFFMAMSSKGNENSCYKLQEPRLSVDCSKNSMEELKKVIRDRLCKQNLLSLKSVIEKAFSNTGLRFTGRNINLSSHTKKLKAPSLIAKLMGLEQFPSGSKDQKIKLEEEMKDRPEQKTLEEIIETMRFKGMLKNNLSERQKAQPDFYQDDQVLPIVILKSVNFPPWDREEINSASEKISEKEKATLAELLLDEITFDHCYMPVKRNLKYNTQPIQNLSIGVDPSQKQPEQEVNMETKRIVDRKCSVIQGKRTVELKQVEAIEESVNKTFAESTKSEKGELTEKLSVKTYKSIKQNIKDHWSTNSMSLKSNCGEKKSKEKPVRKFITESKSDDPKFKDRKLRSSATEMCAISRSNSMIITGGLPTHKKKETIILVNKDENKNDHKIVCEVMPNTYQARRNTIEQSIEVSNNESTTNPAAKSQNLFKHQLLNSKSFHDFAHVIFGIHDRLPMHSQEKNSEDLQVGDEQLLLDCAKELMALRSHERRISISQILQPHQIKGSRFLSFNHLLEEISKGIEELSVYGENREGTITKNSIYIILEKDLNATRDVERNNWICLEMADQVVVEVEKQIISKLIKEVAMDLVHLE